MPLTDIEVRAAKTVTTPKKLFDGGGLYLRIDPKGSKLWRMAYRFDGKERTLSFGGYPGVSLKDARARRDEAKALLADAVDPGQQRKLEKLAKAVSNATTFKGLADEYIDKLSRDGRARDAREGLLAALVCDGRARRAADRRHQGFGGARGVETDRDARQS